MARWVPITEELPPDDLPVLLWGSKLTVGLDQPLAGRRCGCHEQWLVEDAAIQYETEEAREADVEAVVERMLGTVTHWLDWRPGPEPDSLAEPREHWEDSDEILASDGYYGGRP